MKKYYIFGAHSRGQTLWAYLHILHPDWKMMGFLFDNDEINPESIDEIPVFRLSDDNLKIDGTAIVYIATRGTHHDEISKMLKNCGATNIIPVDVSLDNKLRNEFVPDYFKNTGRRYRRLDDLLTDIGVNQKEIQGNNASKVYLAFSTVDSELTEKVPLRDYETYLQAGTALDEKKEKEMIRECVFFDNTGNNISLKNRQMCELTAMYWIWKNAKEDIVGLEHYRRRFVLPDGWEEVIVKGEADVILPVPLYVHPCLKGNYCNRHLEYIWEEMMHSLEKFYPECINSAKDFFDNTGCYSPCNMLIAKREVFNDMCQWLFPILFEVMDKCGIIDDTYQNRYPGFLSERLISFYFFYHEKEISVVYADKTFLK